MLTPRLFMIHHPLNTLSFYKLNTHLKYVDHYSTNIYYFSYNRAKRMWPYISEEIEKILIYIDSEHCGRSALYF